MEDLSPQNNTVQSNLNPANPPSSQTTGLPPIPEKPVSTSLPPNEFISPSSVTINPSGKGKAFGVFVIVGVVIIILIYAVVGYLYFQNQKIKTGSNQTQEKLSGEEITLTPTPEFKPENVKISDGNIVYADKILINKNDYTSTGITGFLKVTVSPNNEKLCFESWPPAPQPAIYVSQSDGTNVTEINANRKNCLWTLDSKRILYVNTSAPNSPTDIYLYDFDEKAEKNLSNQDENSSDTKRFDIVGLSADGSHVICKYETLNIEPKNGSCEIDLTSFELTYQ